MVRMVVLVCLAMVGASEGWGMHQAIVEKPCLCVVCCRLGASGAPSDGWVGSCFRFLFMLSCFEWSGSCVARGGVAAVGLPTSNVRVAAAAACSWWVRLWGLLLLLVAVPALSTSCGASVSQGRTLCIGSYSQRVGTVEVIEKHEGTLAYVVLLLVVAVIVVVPTSGYLIFVWMKSPRVQQILQDDESSEQDVNTQNNSETQFSRRKEFHPRNHFDDDLYRSDDSSIISSD